MRCAPYQVGASMVETSWILVKKFYGPLFLNNMTSNCFLGKAPIFVLWTRLVVLLWRFSKIISFSDSLASAMPLHLTQASEALHCVDWRLELDKHCLRSSALILRCNKRVSSANTVFGSHNTKSPFKHLIRRVQINSCRLFSALLMSQKLTSLPQSMMQKQVVYPHSSRSQWSRDYFQCCSVYAISLRSSIQHKKSA